MENKTCSKCKIVKNIVEFSKNKNTKDRLQYNCKSCYKKYSRDNKDNIKNARIKWKQENPFYRQDWRKENQEHVKQYDKKHYEENKKYYKGKIKIASENGHLVYSAIKQRCNNPKDLAYKWYGGKGVQCLLNREEFLSIYWRSNNCEICGQLLNDQNRRSKNGRSIDRIDNNGNYEKSNLRVICMTCNRKNKPKELSKNV